MPTLKRNVSGVEERKVLGPYEGPEPKPGVYRGVIFSTDLRTSERSGNHYFNVGVRLETDTEPRNQYNGYVSWVILTLSDVEANLSREKAFYRALGIASDEPVVDYDK